MKLSITGQRQDIIAPGKQIVVNVKTADVLTNGVDRGSVRQ